MNFFGLVNITDWILVIIIIVYALHLYFSWNFGTLESLGVPVAKPLPFFGNSLPELYSVLHNLDIEHIKKFGRVYGFYESRRPTLRISDPVMLREIMAKQHDNFRYRRHFNPETKDSTINRMVSLLIGGAHWNVIRTITAPAFTGRRLKQLLPLANECPKTFLDVLAEKADNGQNVDVKEVYIPFLLNVVRSCAFGVDIKASSKQEQADFEKNAKNLPFTRKIIKIFLAMTLPKAFQEIFDLKLFNEQSLNHVRKVLKESLAVKRKGTEKRNDFLEVLLDLIREYEESPNTEGDGMIRIKKIAISEDDIMVQPLLFVFAGFDNTARTLAFATYFAACNPDCQEKVIEEVHRVLEENDNQISYEVISKMTYLDMFLKETLRMHAPVIRIDRECYRDTVVGNIKMKKGLLINIPIYAIHHDPEFYPAPEKFDPERFSPEMVEQRNPYTYMPFGAGPRMCLGLRFMFMQAKLALITVFKEYRFKRARETQVPLEFMRACFPPTPVKAIEVKVERQINRPVRM